MSDFKNAKRGVFYQRAKIGIKTFEVTDAEDRERTAERARPGHHRLTDTTRRVTNPVLLDRPVKLGGKGNPMARVIPWHSINQSIHHNNNNCNTGNNIERENRREGDGGKPLCKECAGLS